VVARPLGQQIVKRNEESRVAMYIMRIFIAVLLASLLSVGSCSPLPRLKTEPDVVFVTTPPRVVREMLKLAEVKPDDVVYDLGSGDGRIVIAAARDFGAKGVGIEIDQNLINASLENARKAGVADRVFFRKEDIFKTDIHEATVVTLFLLPGVNQMLIPKLIEELRPGARVVSHRFDMGDWKPDVSLRGYGSDVYLWHIPARVDGEWNITVYGNGEEYSYTWRFYQTYQDIHGADRKTTFKELHLYGTAIEMVVENNSIGFGAVMELHGRVNGDTMEGAALVKGGPASGEYLFRAVRARRGGRAYRSPTVREARLH
jgi:SAM-dependent methyltransferase